MPGSAVNFRRNGDAPSSGKRKGDTSKLIFWRKELTSLRVGLCITGKDRKEARVHFVDPREMEEIRAQDV